MIYKSRRSKFFNRNILFFFYLIAILLKLSLEISYIGSVSIVYEYEGFISDINFFKYIESWFLYIFLLRNINIKIERVSDYFTALALFVFITPLLVFYELSNGSRWVLYYVILQYLLMVVFANKFNINLKMINNGKSISIFISSIIIITATILTIKAVGFQNFNVNFDNVYEFREYATDSIYQGASGYLVTWATNICTALLLVLFMNNKMYLAALLIFALNFFLFGLTTHKSILFYPALVLFFYFISKYSKSIILLPALLLSLVLAAQAFLYFTDNHFLVETFVRRIFFVPAHHTFFYYNFFEVNSFVFWSNSFLGAIYQYPYSQSISLVIGSSMNEEYGVQGPVAWANNSFFSTGYMHFGVMGILIYGLVSGYILSLLNFFSRKGISNYLIVPLAVTPFYNLFTSSDLVTTLFTHGLFLAIVFIYLQYEKSNN